MPAIRWAVENPTADVNIWYDSTLHEPHSILNTQKVLDEHNAGCSNIKLRDIRSIKVVNDNAVLFHADMPLYYRIDFFKMIICLHELKNEMKDAVIYSDLDVCDLRENHKRMNKEELFNQESLIKLQEVGILLNSANIMAPLNRIPENKFIQMVNDEKAILALRYSINACLMRGTYVLNFMSVQEQKQYMFTMYEQPFLSTICEIYRLYKLIKLGDMKVRADFIGDDTGEQWVEYDPDKHGYNLLGNELYQVVQWVKVEYDPDKHGDTLGNELYQDEYSEDSDDAYDYSNADGIAPFVYRDNEGRVIPLKEIFMRNPTNYNTDDSSFRVRDDTGTRENSGHMDVFVVDPKPDIPYSYTCWTDDGLDLVGSNDSHDNMHDGNNHY